MNALLTVCRKELLETIKPSMRRFLREDTGDMPERDAPGGAGGGTLPHPPAESPRLIAVVQSV